MVSCSFGCHLRNDVCNLVYESLSDLAEKDRSEEEIAFLKQVDNRDVNPERIHEKFHAVITGSHGSWAVKQLGSVSELAQRQDVQDFIREYNGYTQMVSERPGQEVLRSQAEKVCKAFEVIVLVYLNEGKSPSPETPLIAPLSAALETRQGSRYQLGSAARVLVFSPVKEVPVSKEERIKSRACLVTAVLSISILALVGCVYQMQK